MEEIRIRNTNWFIRYWNYITVEPTMVFYMMAFMLTSVVEQSFYVYKACTVNHGFNKTICDHIQDPAYKNITKEVQITSAQFHVWNNIAGHVIPIIVSLFIGAWSDKRGRKLPILIGLAGKLFFSLMIIVNTIQTDWPLEYVIFTATLPCALTGADVTIFGACFAYLVDVTSVKNRTMRMTLLEVAYLATMPIGVALGSYLYKNVLNQSYMYMFVINSVLVVVAIVYSALNLKWRSDLKQRPLSEASNKFFDFFDYKHVVATTRTICMKRPNNRRTFIWLLLIIMAFYTFQRDEREIMFMYCQLVFNWTVTQFSMFRTIQSAVQDVVLLVAIPVMSRLLGIRDTVIVMLGACAHIAARIFYSMGRVNVFYIGGMFAAWGPIVGPVVRSLMSKIVSKSEKGKAFAVLAVADNAVPLISATCYSLLYKVTIHFNPGAIFLLTVATQVAVFCLILYIHVKTTKDEFDIEAVSDITENEKLEV